MTSTSSKLKYCIQKTTIQRDVGLRIYYFAYMNSPLLFLVPSILHICYSNYKLKKQANKMVDDIFTGENSNVAICMVCPWTRSKVVVHGPGVQVLFSPAEF